MIWLIIAHTIFVIAALTIRYMPLTNTLVYSTFPYVYIGIGYLIEVLKLKGHVKTFIAKAGAITGKYSYPLYISHYTVLFVFSKLIHNVLIYAIVSLPIIALIAYGLEDWFQPAVVRYFKKVKPLKENELHLPVVEDISLRAERA